MRVFVAGATGAIGHYLVPSLIAAGHEVTGSTRSPSRAIRLTQAGATPAIVDGLDRQAVIAAVRAAQPDVIVHQMTALASLRNFRRFDTEFAVTNELRTKGTDYLLEAGRQAGTRRFIVQSFTGWNNPRTPGPVTSEDDPLDPHPLPATTETMAAIKHIQETVPRAVPEGIVLRYGMFYGPGTSGTMLDTIRKRKMPVVGGGTGIWSFIEVSDAAVATAAAITQGAPGVYNVVDDDPAPVADWLPYLSSCLGVKPPVHVPVWLGKLLAGELVASLMTETRGASNAKAKRELGWAPRYPSWRDGFPAWTAGGQEAHASAA
jgi:nucleoside-diphosphate-sugar epimerase